MMQQRLFEKISKVVLKSNIDEHEVVPVSLEKKGGRWSGFIIVVLQTTKKIVLRIADAHNCYLNFPTPSRKEIKS